MSGYDLKDINAALDAPIHPDELDLGNGVPAGWSHHREDEAKARRWDEFNAELSKAMGEQHFAPKTPDDAARQRAQQREATAERTEQMNRSGAELDSMLRQYTLNEVTDAAHIERGRRLGHVERKPHRIAKGK